jgi:hypothetical protein
MKRNIHVVFAVFFSLLLAVCGRERQGKQRIRNRKNGLQFSILMPNSAWKRALPRHYP